MQLSPVTFVLAKTVFGKTRAEFPHQSVARHFRDHARRRDAEAETIAVDDRGLRKRKREHRQTIDEHMLRRDR